VIGLRLRPRSLFFTFAGAFLAVVAVAAVVQGVVLALLGERLAQERAANQAQRPALEASLDLARLDDQPGRIGPRLREGSANDGSFFLVYQRTDGHVVLPWPAERELRHRLARWLATGEDRWGVDPRWDSAFTRPDERRPPPTRAGRPPRGARPRGDRLRPDGPPPDGRPPDGRPPDRRPGDPPPRGPTLGRDDLPAPGRLVELARLAVQQTARSSETAATLGQVVVVHPRRRGALWNVGETPAFVLLPLALVLAALAGLVLFRLLTRRLERLERLASRLAAGDLAARIEDPGPDEIGRLGARLNRMAAALEEARTQVEASVAERRRLLADISHELATPLTSIRGYAETLSDDQVPTSPEERAQYVAHIEAEARRMELLLGDLFDLTRLEAGVGALERERLDATALSGYTVERFGPRFDQAGLTATFDGPAPVWIDADGRRMEQVLENLLTNAIRYVPRGGRVEVAVTSHDREAVLEVADSGPGFPAEDLPHVFDRFYRSDATSSLPGSGLGLAIVQEIVQRHGGRVEADNRLDLVGGGGAVLRVVLPRA
jgi:signal transduction histidine kinase